MYGLVNRGVEDLICRQYGEETWEKIKEKAGFATETFISSIPYSDDTTSRLMVAAGEVLGLTTEQVMNSFGEHWLHDTTREGYEEMIRMSGDTLPEFLFNLDTLHTRVALIYPNLRPPSYECTDVTEQGMLLHYRSHRLGMAPLVIGLLRGLSEKFATPMTIEHISHSEEQGVHDIFKLTYEQK